MSKLADAYYLAKQLELTVRVFFGFCGHQEVFSYLFEPRPINEAQILEKIMASITDGNYMHMMPDMHIKVSNDVPGFRKIKRVGRSANSNTTDCPCLDSTGQRFDSDIELFSDLRDNRFRGRDKVDDFRQRYFSDHTVIGLHVRAGNGEKGDFERKNREIRDIDQWCLSISQLLMSMAESFKENEPPLLFIASDMASIITKLRTVLEGKMEVVDFQQDRVDHGEGVLFGATGDVNSDGDQCKNGWLNSFTDMMLLSHADILIAGRPSSFTQSLPMTLALSTPKSERKVRKSFCEVDPNATALMCFEDLEDWCCGGITSFSLNSIQLCDYRRMPQVGGLDIDMYKKKLEMRPRARDACIPKLDMNGACLPYKMPNEKSLMKMRERQMGRKPRRRIND